MAKAATTGANSDKKKKKVGAATVRIKVKGPKKGAGDKKGKKSDSPKKNRKPGLEALAKLADHPMIAELLAAGAVAAVAAIAEHQRGDKKQSSSKLVKSAGQAAASAIGKRLLNEFGAIKTASTAAAKKA